KPLQSANIYYPDNALTPAEFFAEYTSSRQEDDRLTFEMQSSGFHKFNQNHIKYRPSYKGVPFYGREITLHLKEGKIDHVTGEMPQNIDIQSIHTQNEKSIIHQLKSALLS